jgi:hypothetical protein
MTQYARTAFVSGFDHVPPLDTGRPANLQFAVDLGALCADAWLEFSGIVRLHDYVTRQTEAFVQGLQSSAQTLQRWDTPHIAVARDAFVAGLIGRIQQYLLGASGRSRSA